MKVYGVQKVISTESNKLSTKEWFDKDRKEKKIDKKVKFWNSLLFIKITFYTIKNRMIPKKKLKNLKKHW